MRPSISEPTQDEESQTKACSGSGADVPRRVGQPGLARKSRNQSYRVIVVAQASMCTRVIKYVGVLLLGLPNIKSSLDIK